MAQADILGPLRPPSAFTLAPVCFADFAVANCHKTMPDIDDIQIHGTADKIKQFLGIRLAKIIFPKTFSSKIRTNHLCHISSTIHPIKFAFSLPLLCFTLCLCYCIIDLRILFTTALRVCGQSRSGGY